MTGNFSSIWEEFILHHDRARKNLKPWESMRWGRSWIQSKDSPWIGFPHRSDISLPEMLTDEEVSYLAWLTSEQIRGDFSLVEIGPWLGFSTRLLTYGKNQRFKVTTIDDFIWRKSWMDSYVNPEFRLDNGASFLEQFKTLNSDYLEYIEIIERRLNVYDGNEKIPQLQSFDLPDLIDVLFVDCGRTLEVNETWWAIMEPKLIPNQTLVVMQDWRLWREIPFKFYNQTLFFTEAHSENLQLIHEVSDGGLAAFIYTK